MRRFHYAWLILASSFVIITVAVSSRTALGAFVRPWEADFATTRATIAGIGLVSFNCLPDHCCPFVTRTPPIP